MQKTKWQKLSFGKHKEKTLPYIALSDPGYIIWGKEKNVFKGGLAKDASDILYRMRRINLPLADGLPSKLYCGYDSRRHFTKLHLFPKNSHYVPSSSIGPYSILNLVNLIQRLGKSRVAVSRILRDVKHLLFYNRRITARICEEFFSDDNNFCLTWKHRPAEQRFIPSNVVEARKDLI